MCSEIQEWKRNYSQDDNAHSKISLKKKTIQSSHLIKLLYIQQTPNPRSAKIPNIPYLEPTATVKFLHAMPIKPRKEQSASG